MLLGQNNVDMPDYYTHEKGHAIRKRPSTESSRKVFSIFLVRQERRLAQYHDGS
jgi:hypothetical protein